MNKLGAVILGATLVGVLGVGGLRLYNGYVQSRIYSDLVAVIDGFHGNIETLSTSVKGKDSLQEELRKMKSFASSAREATNRMQVEARQIHSRNRLALDEALEKTNKYLAGFERLANLSVTKETLVAKSDTMLINLENFRQRANLYGSPDKGDTSDAIARATKLANNFDKARKSVASSGSGNGISGTGTRVIVVNRYWNNPAYADYRSEIASIVAEYSSGRKILSSVLTHYDRGQLTDNDRANWRNEMSRRSNLISQLQAIENDIPPGSVYGEHHRLLQRMLENASGAMRQFAGNESSGNRAYLSQVSRENTAIMNRLKRFYGIR